MLYIENYSRISMLCTSYSTESKMKHFGSLCILFILVHFSTQIPKYENCPEDVIRGEQCECCEMKCIVSSNGVQMIGKACPESIIDCPPGTQMGYHEDKTKVYPECCRHPICQN